MSITRDSNFYYEIVAALTKGLKEKDYEIPEDVIKSVLSELFDSVAIHVWSRSGRTSFLHSVRPSPVSTEKRVPSASTRR